jgi:hypothetical protein
VQRARHEETPPVLGERAGRGGFPAPLVVAIRLERMDDHDSGEQDAVPGRRQDYLGANSGAG